MRDSDLNELRSLLGSGFRELDPVEERAGCRLRVSLEPRSSDELAESLALLSAHRQSVLLMGAGTRLDLGNPIRDTSIALSCRLLSGVDELDEADGVVRVAAGTPLAELSRQVEAAGWLLPLSTASGPGTLGGALATAFSGPRRLGFGPVRDCVLGVDTVLASGERVRCGARVVKNVTGYDMAKLYVGSLGTLAVIERVWLRLSPRPRSVRVLEVHPTPGDDVFGLALEAARRPGARAVALIFSGPNAGGSENPSAGNWRLLAEFAGEQEVTEWNAGWLAAGRQSVASDVSAVDRLGDLQVSGSRRAMRLRIHILPGDLERCCARLQVLAARLLVYPEPAVVHALFENEDGDVGWSDDLLQRLAKVREEFGAQTVVEALPEGRESGGDVFEGAQPLALMRSLKKSFDPGEILNPGRFAGLI
jgi:glycolate oxidase FAD binding subunit